MKSALAILAENAYQVLSYLERMLAKCKSGVGESLRGERSNLQGVTDIEMKFVIAGPHWQLAKVQRLQNS